MGYYNYIENGNFKGAKGQKNLMLLVGNGFDIQCLNTLGVRGSTRYESFYYYLCSKGVTPESNTLQSWMKSRKDEGKKDWCDFECAIMDHLKSNEIPNIQELTADLTEVQNFFAEYLNKLITPEIIKSIGEKIAKENLAIEGLQKFLGDLSENDYRSLHFKDSLEHYLIYNIKVMNFNYTTLFDNYMYLDRDNFDPHPHKNIDTNFEFYPNPNGFQKIYNDLGNFMNSKTIHSSNLMLEIEHPHGSQFVPKSMLFGFYENLNNADNSKYKDFLKNYWTQGDKKYQHLFPDTDLFIVFGLSLGKTDSWWWKNIIDTLRSGKSELIIYYYDSGNNISSDDVKNMFLDASNCQLEIYERNYIKTRISVVTYTNNNELKAFRMS